MQQNASSSSMLPSAVQRCVVSSGEVAAGLCVNSTSDEEGLTALGHGGAGALRSLPFSVHS